MSDRPDAAHSLAPQDPSQFDLVYLSLGAGTQSTAMLIMSNLSIHGCPRADAAIFADTHAEPPWVYETLKRMQDWSSIPVHVVSAGSLPANIKKASDGLATRFGSIPGFTDMGKGDPPSMLRRQCTREYKITPIEKKAKELLGYKKGQHVKKRALSLIGISTDEVQRMKPSRTPWITNDFPLVNARMNRGDCERLIADHGFPPAGKSACVFCPYRSNEEWKAIQRDPASWDMATRVDSQIRDLTAAGAKYPVYLHRSCKPLGEVNFDGDPNQGQFNFMEECEGMCGV